MHDVTIIIKTFERPNCLMRLLHSIQRAKFSGPVLVADDSRNPVKETVLSTFPSLVTEFFAMPFDSGASAGRNLLLENVKTPYVVLCDDDFVFDARTRLDRFQAILQETDIELVGGPYYDLEPFSWKKMLSYLLRFKLHAIRNQIQRTGSQRDFFGDFIEKDNNCIEPKMLTYSAPYVICDFVLNFFMAETKAIREKVGGWDASIKIGGEHEEFFYQAKLGGLKVAHTEQAGVLHIHELPKTYAGFRDRAKNYRPEKFKNWF